MSESPRAQQYDVIVLGAGPAGATAARFCAQFDLDVLLIDKSPFPRHKACGNLITEMAINELECSLPDSIVTGECRGAVVTIADRTVEIELPFRMAQFASRYDFDQFLVDKAVEAGAEFRPGTGVSKLAQDESAVTLCLEGGEEVCARFLIGADGATGISAAFVRGKRYRRREYFGAVMAMRSKQDHERFGLSTNQILVDLNVGRTGYFWLFPQGTEQNVGLAASPLVVQKLGRVWREHCDAFELDGCGQQRGHIIPMGGVPRRWSRGRVILVGDAAGFVDTISGEGIGYAIASGKIAARAVAESRTSRDEPRRATHSYRRAVRRQIHWPLFHSLMFSAALFLARPLFFSLPARTIESSFRRLFEVMATRRSYQSYVRWAAVRLPLPLMVAMVRMPFAAMRRRTLSQQVAGERRAMVARSDVNS